MGECYKTFRRRLRIPEANLKLVVREEHVGPITTNFEWRRVAPFLLDSPQDIQDIEKDYTLEQERRIKTINRWMATKADRATYDKLIRALHHCSRSDQALHVAEILRRSLRPSESSNESNYHTPPQSPPQSPPKLPPRKSRLNGTTHTVVSRFDNGQEEGRVSNIYVPLPPRVTRDANSPTNSNEQKDFISPPPPHTLPQVPQQHNHHTIQGFTPATVETGVFIPYRVVVERSRSLSSQRLCLWFTLIALMLFLGAAIIIIALAFGVHYGINSP